MLAAMNDDFFDDFFEIPGHGGSRKRNPEDGNIPADADDSKLTAAQRYQKGRADKEYNLARQAAVKADLDEKIVVNRQAVQDASAKAFAACSQALDSIGDQLERDGFSQDVAERVMEIVNAAKQQLAEDLERTYEANRD